MAVKALSVYLGREAARRIASEGWSADLFSLLLGASGGPKWLILGHLDRLLFGDFLARGKRPLSALGSSIGSWRHACLAMPDPVAAIDRLEQAYLAQHYATRPTPARVSAVSATCQLMMVSNGRPPAPVSPSKNAFKISPCTVARAKWIVMPVRSLR